MNDSHPKTKAVEVKASNRPIKIAYLVPSEETPENHMILDAIFNESYARWAGVYTLIIPSNHTTFQQPEYRSWLKFFDPDFVYSYLELDSNLVGQIDRACTPIVFIPHKMRGETPSEGGWRAFSPHWGIYFQAVSSRTTIPSPQTQPISIMGRELEPEVMVATQFGNSGTMGRLFSDNFGNEFQVGAVTHALPGLYKTLCLTPPDLAKNIIVGTERCTSMAEMLSAINKRKALPIARLAMAHSEAMPKIEQYPWADSFSLVVGSTVLDRLHFWNSRHLVPSYYSSVGSMIVDPTFFTAPELVKLLGEYLNHNNSLGQRNGPAHVTIRSYGLTIEELSSSAESLRKHTYNQVILGKDLNLPAVPREEDFERGFMGGSTDTVIFKLNEDSNTIVAKEPSHFAYFPPRFRGIASGQWITELEIQRHNNLSKFSNIIDNWELPRRRQIVRAFTNNLGKVTRTHQLAVLPANKDFPYARSSGNQDYSYTLSLPDDGTFFRLLVLRRADWYQDDLRASILKPHYRGLQISDKGQNFRGVISMFPDLHSAYQVLTNTFWRRVLLGERKDTSVRHLVFTRNKLNSYLPNDLPTKQELKKKLQFADIGEVAKYLERNLTDTLEYLVRLKVFYCVHQWRCEYCGHTNTRSFDFMKIKNDCEICSTEYLAKIDLEWTYQLNEFVYRSLVLQTGLPVLWTLGFLHDQVSQESFWYLPEVDLFEKDDAPEPKKEVDILCMRGGKFIAIEAKRSASQLMGETGIVESFVQKMNLIQPDIAMLAFEQYCDPKGDTESVKTSLKKATEDIRSGIDSNIKLNVLVATDVQGFDEAPTDLGYWGERTE